MNEKLEKNENKKTADVLRAENLVRMCSMEKMVKRRKRSTS